MGARNVAVGPTLARATVLLVCLAQDDPEQEAREALAAVEAMVERGQHEGAVQSYRRLAALWPETEAGREALSRTEENAFLGWSWIQESGPSSNRVVVVVMGDGYTLGQQRSLDSLAAGVPRAFSRSKVLDEYLSYHNFLRVNLRSREGSVSGYGRAYDTMLGAEIRGRNAPWVTVRRERVREVLARLPVHDNLAVVFVKPEGHSGTGGGGIAVVGGRDEYTLVHEWAHAFAGLGDEYATFTFDRGNVRQRPNVSDTDDPAKVPWRHWLEARAPSVGIHRGADGRQDGAWRPTASECIMQSTTKRRFCKVCAEAMVLAIHRFVDPIEGTDPPENPREPDLTPGENGNFEVRVQLMTPKTHGMDLAWWVFPEEEAPPSVPSGPFADRRERGKLPEIEARPQQQFRDVRAREARFVWRPRRGETGRFRVVFRARDHTKIQGDTWPLVLSDPQGLLESERAWWVRVD